MSKGNIYILGFSGHALSVIDALKSKSKAVTGYFDQKINEDTTWHYCGEESLEIISKILTSEDILFPSVGSNPLRKKMYSFIEECGVKMDSIFHVSAIISDTAVVGNSCFLSAGSIVNAKTRIGNAVIINTGAIIEHECLISNFVHIGPGAVLAGNVTIDECSFIGANSTIKQGVVIGKNVIIGSGSVVLNNVPDNSVFVGNPAKFLKYND